MLLIFQLLYYYIIVYYLKYKLISINTFIKELARNNNKRKNNLFIIEVIRDLYDTYFDINEYNNNYWSKYLLIIWITFGTIISFVGFLALNSYVNIIIKF